MSDIKLRLDGENEDVELKPVEYKEKIQIDQSIKFSPEEEKQIDDFSQKIDLEDSNIILQYGVGAQKKISSLGQPSNNPIKRYFSAWSNVRIKRGLLQRTFYVYRGRK